MNYLTDIISNGLSAAAPAPVKRGPGRPKKIKPTPAWSDEATPLPYDDAMWYLAAEDHTEKDFGKYVDEQRELYASGSVDPELMVHDDQLIRELVEPPCGRWGFTSEGLERYAYAHRGPFMHEGKPTHGGVLKARVLLVRERLIAGTVSNRAPDLNKIRHTFPEIYRRCLDRR